MEARLFPTCGGTEDVATHIIKLEASYQTANVIWLSAGTFCYQGNCRQTECGISQIAEVVGIF